MLSAGIQTPEPTSFCSSIATGFAGDGGGQGGDPISSSTVATHFSISHLQPGSPKKLKDPLGFWFGVTKFWSGGFSLGSPYFSLVSPGFGLLANMIWFDGTILQFGVTMLESGVTNLHSGVTILRFAVINALV